MKSERIWGTLVLTSEFWPLRRIDSLGRIVTGKTPSSKNPEYFNGPFPFITIPDLENKLFMEITEYGDRPYIEGIMEDPLNLFIVLGGFIFLVIIYFVKQKEKKNQIDPHSQD